MAEDNQQSMGGGEGAGVDGGNLCGNIDTQLA